MHTSNLPESHLFQKFLLAWGLNFFSKLTEHLQYCQKETSVNWISWVFKWNGTLKRISRQDSKQNFVTPNLQCTATDVLFHNLKLVTRHYFPLSEGILYLEARMNFPDDKVLTPFPQQSFLLTTAHLPPHFLNTDILLHDQVVLQEIAENTVTSKHNTQSLTMVQ